MQEREHNPDGRCAACGGALQFFGPRDGYRYALCSQCGTLQLDPLPSKEDLAKAYTDFYSSAQHISPDPLRCIAEAHTHYVAVANALAHHLPSGRVLDYGPGWGGLCRLLRSRGYDCDGIELSAEMAAYCRRQGLPVRHGDIAIAADNAYDALVLCSVFEHLTDHPNWLAKAHRLLKRDGILISMQPTAHFPRFMGTLLRLGRKHLQLPQLHQVICPPWHTVLFSIEGMTRLLKHHGFELLEIRPAPQQRSGGMTEWIQRALETVNRAGWNVAGTHWPLLIGHAFVFKKLPE